MTENPSSGRLSCYGRKQLQTIFTMEISIEILAASICMIDFFVKNMAASISIAFQILLISEAQLAR